MGNWGEFSVKFSRGHKGIPFAIIPIPLLLTFCLSFSTDLHRQEVNAILEDGWKREGVDDQAQRLLEEFFLRMLKADMG